MDTAGSRTRRSTRAVLLGSALAALLTVTTAGAASGAYQASAGTDTDSAVAASVGGHAAGILAPTDVYIKDHASDTGVQPHALNPIYWSPDIKVCPSPADCGASQNPIVGYTNYIFVTLRNPGPYGSGTDSGTIHLYRTTPGGGSAWPGDWTPIGSAAAVVPPGTTTVVVPWNDVPGPGHFCLLARWVSANDPIGPEGPVTTTNTRNSNNIAWRNVDSVVIEPTPGSVEVRPFSIGNALRTETRNDIVFTQPAGRPFREVGGQVIVDLGQTLFERWRRGGGAGTNIRQVGETQVEILEPAKASLNNLVLGPGERFTFQIRFTAKAPSSEPFLLNVAQFGPEGTDGKRTDLGGVGYQVTVGRNHK